jgi:hypothetical protein
MIVYLITALILPASFSGGSKVAINELQKHAAGCNEIIRAFIEWRREYIIFCVYLFWF